MSVYPTVSIIVVNWNGLHHLRDCLPSLFSQDYPQDKLEWLVVDNGSIDGSREFVTHRFPQVIWIQNSENQGFAKPNNDAARQARGEYLALINNDMRADPRWVAELVARLDEAGTAVCVGSKILSWDGNTVDFNGGTLQLLGYAAQSDIGRAVSEIEDVDREILFACGGSMLIRRDVFLQAGGFDEDYFAIYEDVDLGWRLWLAGYRVLYASRSKVFHKLHGTLERSREEKMRYLMHRNALFTIIKNYSDTTLQKVFPLAVIQAIRRAVYFSGMDRSSFYLWKRQDDVIGDRHEPPDGVLWQCRDAMNHLVMLDDVFDALPRLRKKRAAVQGLRKVEDSEILVRFGDPFRTIVEDARYQALEEDLLEHLRLVDVFTASPEAPGANKVVSKEETSRLLEQIRVLERQKKQLEQQLLEVLSDGKPDPRARAAPAHKTARALATEFTGMARRKGLTAAVRQTLRYLRRSNPRRRYY